jgi:hypothetical protein
MTSMSEVSSYFKIIGTWIKVFVVTIIVGDD